MDEFDHICVFILLVLLNLILLQIENETVLCDDLLLAV